MDCRKEFGEDKAWLFFLHANRYMKSKHLESFSINNGVSLSDMRSGWDPSQTRSWIEGKVS